MWAAPKQRRGAAEPKEGATSVAGGQQLDSKVDPSGLHFSGVTPQNKNAVALARVRRLRTTIKTATFFLVEF